jgi:hypothetical protein
MMNQQQGKEREKRKKVKRTDLVLCATSEIVRGVSEFVKETTEAYSIIA